MSFYPTNRPLVPKANKCYTVYWFNCEQVITEKIVCHSMADNPIYFWLLNRQAAEASVRLKAGLHYGDNRPKLHFKRTKKSPFFGIFHQPQLRVIITISLRKYHFKQHSSGTKIISLIIVNFVTPKNGAKLLFQQTKLCKAISCQKMVVKHKSDLSSTPKCDKNHSSDTYEFGKTQSWS